VGEAHRQRRPRHHVPLHPLRAARSYWTHDKRSLDINAVPQDYVGYTSANPNWYNGPMNDWPYASDSQFMWAYTKTLPNPVCGGQPLVHS